MRAPRQKRAQAAKAPNGPAAETDRPSRGSQPAQLGIRAYADLTPKPPSLKDLRQLCEGFNLNKVTSLGRSGKSRMLKNPCVFMEKKHGMEAGGKSRIYVALRTVSDHPPSV